MKTTGCILFGLLCNFSILAFGQNASNDFYRINKAYQAHDYLHVHMKINAYSSWTDKSAYEQKSCEVKKSKAQRNTNLGEMVMIVNNKYSVTVDQQAKKILLLPASISEFKLSDNELMIPKLDSMLLSICKKVEFTKESDGLYTYEFTMETGDYERMKLTFSPKTFLIQRMVFFYKKEQQFEGSGPTKKPRLEIIYQKTEFPKYIDEEEFTYNQYIIKQNGKLVCRPAYKSFQLINQLPQK